MLVATHALTSERAKNLPAVLEGRHERQRQRKTHEQIGEDRKIAQINDDAPKGALPAFHVRMDREEELQQQAEPGKRREGAHDCTIFRIRSLHAGGGTFSKKSTTPVSNEYSAPTTISPAFCMRFSMMSEP